MHVDFLNVHVLPNTQYQLQLHCSGALHGPLGPMQSLLAVGPQRWSPFHPELGCLWTAKISKALRTQSMGPGFNSSQLGSLRIRRVCVEGSKQ